MPKLWKLTAMMIAVVFLTACPSPPKVSHPLTPLGTTRPLVPASTNESGRISDTIRLPEPGTNRPISNLDGFFPSHLRLPLDQWVSWETWNQMNGLSKPNRLDNGSSPTFQSRSSNGVLSVTVGNRMANWNGLALALGFVPHLTNGHPFVHALDLMKNVAPLLAMPALVTNGKRVIVIDPGHGGENTGAKCVLNTGFEKDYTLDWAVRLKPLLASRGWNVFLTRTADLDVPLTKRVRLAEKVKADLFVSLHFNSVDPPFATSEHGGIETYCLTPSGMPSNLTRDFADNPTTQFPNNAFDAPNLQFATKLHQAIVEFSERKDRGIRRARFMTVLRGQNRPAVLLEGGYMSDPQEARLVATGAYRQKLAEAVAKALE